MIGSRFWGSLLREDGDGPLALARLLSGSPSSASSVVLRCFEGVTESGGGGLQGQSVNLDTSMFVCMGFC